MNKPENCLNSLDSSINAFTTHNFYSPKIICISFPILKKKKKKAFIQTTVYHFKAITATHGLLLREIERGSGLVISTLDKTLLFHTTSLNSVLHKIDFYQFFN